MEKRVAIYARFSSDKQRESSIDDQVRRCRDHVARTGGDPAAAEVYADYAVSGASLQRPGFEAMMAEVELGSISAIVTEDLSRISRDFADAGAVFRRLQFLGVPLIGVADGIDTGAPGALLAYGVKSIVAATFLAELGDKTHRGLAGRFRQGLATGAVPYGFKTRKTEAGSVIEIDEDRAAIVRDIFRAYKRGRSFAAIAADLNERGVPTPRKRSRGWVATSVRSILDNEKYAGRWRWNKTQWLKRPGTGDRVARDRDAGDVLVDDRPELAIVGAELWAAVRARRERVASTYQRAGGRATSRRVFPFSGLLRCGVCDSTMIIHGGSRTAKAYRCSDNRKRGTCSNALSVREEHVREALLAELRVNLARPAALAFMRSEIERLLAGDRQRTDAQLDRARRELAKTQDKIARLVRSLEDGEATSAVTRRIVELEALELTQRRRVADLRRGAQVAGAELPDVAELERRALAITTLVDSDPAAAREKLGAVFGGRVPLEPTAEGYVAHTKIFPAVLFAENANWHPNSECQSTVGSGGPIRSADWQRFSIEREVPVAA